MSMSINDCAGRIDSKYGNFCPDIIDDFDKQKAEFDQQEAEKKKKAESNTNNEQREMSSFTSNSKIPTMTNRNATQPQPYVPGTFNWNMSFTRFFQVIAQELDIEFQKGTVSLKNVDITTPAGTLEFIEQSTAFDNIREIAEKTSAYWATTIMPTGIPQTKTISVVVNTAASIIAPIIADLTAYSMSPIQDNGFKRFVEIIITHVKTITWTVTELDQQNKPVIFTVTVS